MNSEILANKAKTGIWGLDDILSGGFSRGHVFLVEGAPGTGKTTIALQFLIEGAKAGEKCLYITLSETERELREGAASHGWTLGEQHRGIRTVAAGKPAGCRPAAEPALFVRPRTRRDHQADFRGGGTRAAKPGRARQPVGNPPAGAKLAALSAADPGDQALFREIRHDGPAARRPDRRSGRQDRAQRRPWRDPAGGTGAGLRRRTAARARRQIPRRKISRRLSRFHHHHRRLERVSASGGVGASQPLRADHDVQRHCRTGSAARRRHRSRIQHADPGTGRHRQIARCDRLRRGGDRARRKGRAVRFRRRTRPAV